MNNNSEVRLFIAINFDEPNKDAIYHIMERLKSYTLQGSYTCKENLHLTLVFIGEVPVSKIDSIKACINQVKSKPFTITIGGIGRFKRSGGDIYWIGVEKNSSLLSIYKQLCDQLISLGFDIENREYKPHLTIARRVTISNDFDETKFSESVPNMDVLVQNIFLMKSERIKGKLTYTPIYQKDLF
mgnify:CR=1 FL=1